MRCRISVAHAEAQELAEAGFVVWLLGLEVLGLKRVALLLAGLDRHCRSHNIAAECCVWSSGESGDGLASRCSKAGEEKVR